MKRRVKSAMTVLLVLVLLISNIYVGSNVYLVDDDIPLAAKVDTFNMQDFSNWKTGDYNCNSGKYEKFPSRIAYVDSISVNSGEVYTAVIKDSSYHILVREMDENKRMVISHNLGHGDQFTVGEYTEALNVCIYNITSKSSTLTFDSYKELFDNSFTVYLSRVIQTKEDVDVFGMKDINSWISGSYDFNTGKFDETETRRISIKNYVDVPGETVYKAHVSSDRYRILVRELNSDGYVLQRHTLYECNEFTTQKATVKLAITIYNCYTENTSNCMTYDKYVSLFESGFNVYLTCESEDEVIEEEPVKDETEKKETVEEKETEVESTEGDLNIDIPEILLPETSNTVLEDVEIEEVADSYKMLYSKNWKSGWYDNSGEYQEASDKICMANTLSFDKYAEFKAHVSDTHYKLIVRGLDDEGEILCSYVLEDGQSFEKDTLITKLELGLYDSDGSTTINDLKSELNNGLRVYLEYTGDAGYSALSDNSKAVVDYLNKCMNNSDMTTWDVLDKNITFSEYYNSLAVMVKKHCNIARKNSVTVYPGGSIKGKYMSTVGVTGVDTGCADRLAGTKKVISNILSGMDDQMSDLDKVLYMHDYVVPNCTYGGNSYNSIYRSVGACLSDKQCICVGFSQTMILLLKQVGVEAVEISSSNHEWTGVIIDGEYYHLDATWDSSRTDQNIHKYLLRTDSEYRSSCWHADWSTYFKIEITSKRFTDWFVHDVNGRMYYYDGFWYYQDTNTNSIYKSRVEGADKAIVYDGSSQSDTVAISSIDNNLLKVSIGDESLTLDLNK